MKSSWRLVLRAHRFRQRFESHIVLQLSLWQNLNLKIVRTSCINVTRNNTSLVFELAGGNLILKRKKRDIVLCNELLLT